MWCQTVAKLKDQNPTVAIEQLCKLFGKTRHAYYDNTWRAKDNLLKDEIILQLVASIRTALPRIGTRKLHHMLKSQLQEHCLEIGRDYLFALLAENKLLIRTRKRKVTTTQSHHWMRKYSNLIREQKLIRPEQIWVSDITYIRIIKGFVYLSLITDAYSRKIVGYNLQRDLSSEGSLKALDMALSARMKPWQPLIHHSDRGVQYCSKSYVDRLTEHNIAISMTENGDPYENALAERVNGILKTEFNLYITQSGFEETCHRVEQSIYAYNQLRPHSSCDYLTPTTAHTLSGPIKKRW